MHYQSDNNIIIPIYRHNWAALQLVQVCLHVWLVPNVLPGFHQIAPHMLLGIHLMCYLLWLALRALTLAYTGLHWLALACTGLHWLSMHCISVLTGHTRKKSDT